jgi:hypothetical protein
MSGAQLWVLFLQLLELPEKGIVGVIRYDGVIEYVIAVAMVVQLLAQFLYPSCYIHG